MKRTILFSLVIVALISCGKDKDECKRDTASITGTYKITSLKYKATATSQEADVFNDPAYLEACQKDDTFGFGANGIFTYTDAGTKCTPPNDDTDTWGLSGNSLLFFGESYTIESFDCKTLTISLSDYNTSGDKITFGLKKQ